MVLSLVACKHDVFGAVRLLSIGIFIIAHGYVADCDSCLFFEVPHMRIDIFHIPQHRFLPVPGRT